MRTSPNVDVKSGYIFPANDNSSSGRLTLKAVQRDWHFGFLADRAWRAETK